MRRKAYTLAEVLVALGIVGVLAAVMIPLINKAKPDANKIKYLKSYDSLVEVVSSLANNSRMFPQTSRVRNIDNVDRLFQFPEYPLLDYSLPTVTEYNDTNRFQGAVKLCNLIMESFGASQVHACSSSQDGTFDDNYNFETKNGVRWWIVPYSDTNDPIENVQYYRATIGYYTKVTIDINGTQRPNTLNNNSSDNDRFEFYIEADGNVVPADRLGQAYIATRTKTKKTTPNIASYTAKNPNNLRRVPVYNGTQNCQELDNGRLTCEEVIQELENNWYRYRKRYEGNTGIYKNDPPCVEEIYGRIYNQGTKKWVPDLNPTVSEGFCMLSS